VENLKRKVFVVKTPSVTGNKVMNIPRVRRHACLWVTQSGSATKCKDKNCDKTL
jgi:hypothetical protein